MSDLTNTPKRPSYGRAAERYTAERALGSRVLDLLLAADRQGLKLDYDDGADDEEVRRNRSAFGATVIEACRATRRLIEKEERS